ncbi:hypothetical protein predicted by Glimmer/Critica [Stenotrophomonas maltophilia RA8]|nr:hypothetical protein predicted by Glimmer/Critica [Stenotrophomonas maltophilia RA8]
MTLKEVCADDARARGAGGGLSMRTLMWGLGGLFVAYVAGCSAISAWHSRALASVPVGAGKAEVLRALGQPDVVEHAGVPFTRYASSGCSGRCAQRWWYESRLGLDTDAWSVKLDASDRVLTTSRWTSP